MIAAFSPTGAPAVPSIGRVNDGELVERARRGDTDAFGVLVDRHRAAVYRAARAALGSAGEAEEVAQEAFLAAYRNLASYREEASFRTWLLRIAWRQALNRRRRLVWRWRRLVSAADGAGAPLLWPVAGPTPEAALLDAELAGHVRRLVRALPARLRDALLLCADGEQTYREIAVVLGIPEGTLKWRVAEARRRIKRRLVQMGYRDE
jgi:RNA polymerase sigma-70 factor, ECF subfamily